MRRMLAIVLALPLASCVTHPEYDNFGPIAGNFDDNICKQHGYSYGTDAYAQCRAHGFFDPPPFSVTKLILTALCGA